MTAVGVSRAERAAVAAHRFGFGEPDLAALGGDAQGWVLQQLRQPAPLVAEGLMDSAQAGALGRQLLANAAGLVRTLDDDARKALRAQLRGAALAGWERRWQHTVQTPTPVHERWVQFWANHFSVSALRAVVAPLVLPFEREAIRAQATGRFVDLLRAATLHPAMLLFLDNAQSMGPQSRAGLRRARGLNENLARELLELHTLGVAGGYRQEDVTETARLLTGWTVTRPLAQVGAADAPRFGTEFNPNWHEPGVKTVLGRRYAEGPQALEALLLDLARAPATARHLSRQLARHFVADDPPAALVDAVARRWQDSDGDLLAVAEALFSHPEAWRVPAAKVKRPEEWVLSAHRVLGVPVAAPDRLFAALVTLGQAPGQVPSPQGWPDRAEDWLGPDALLKRVEWAVRFAQRDAPRGRRQVSSAASTPPQWASASLGPWLGDVTLGEIQRADSAAQALALWLASPEFQRR